MKTCIRSGFIALLFLVAITETSLSGRPSVSGVVVDQFGNPLANAKVSIDECPWCRTTTDMTGRFTLELPQEFVGEQGRIRIEKDPWYDPWFEDIVLVPHQLRPIKLKPKSSEPPPSGPIAAALTLKAVDEKEGILISNALVTIDEKPAISKTTDTYGQCVLEFQGDDLGNRMRIRVEAKGYIIWFRDIVVREEMPPLIAELQKIARASNLEAALRSLVIPGWGQRYKCHSSSKWTWAYGLTGAGVLIAYLIYSNEWNDYREADAINDIENHYRKADLAHKTQITLAVGLPTIAVLSSVHAFISEDKCLYRKAQRKEVDLLIKIDNENIEFAVVKAF